MSRYDLLTGGQPAATPDEDWLPWLRYNQTPGTPTFQGPENSYAVTAMHRIDNNLLIHPHIQNIIDEIKRELYHQLCERIGWPIEFGAIKWETYTEVQDQTIIRARVRRYGR